MKRLSAFTLMLLMIAGMTAAQDAAERQRPTRAENRAIERIVALEREIETLMASLPPHLRDVVRERLAAEAAARAAETAAAALVEERATSSIPSETTVLETAPTAAGTTKPADARPEPSAPERAAPVVRPAKTASCTTLWTFDTDRNGRLDGLDRYWRHIYLWADANGDGAVDEREVESAYERGVQDIAVALDVFIRRKKETAGEIEIGKYIVLDVAGDGFDGWSGRRDADDGALAIDATRLARGDGPTLLDQDDQPLAGYQAFRSGLRLRLASGEVVTLSCPE